MYIIIHISFLFYTYTYYYILLIIFSRDYLEIFGGRFGKIWIAPVILAKLTPLTPTSDPHTFCTRVYRGHLLN